MSKRLYYSLVGLSVLSFIGQMLLYPSLPDSIPIHWDSNWQVSDYAPKRMAIVIALVPLAVMLLLKVLPKIDPRRRNYEQFSGAYTVVMAVVCLLLMGAGWMSAAVSLGAEINIQLFMPLIIGVAFLALGNFMPQFRQSYFLGIRTPWTLANAEVWRKTHRLGGILFCLTGIVIGMSAFLPIQGMAAASVLVTVIVLFGYSYLIFQKLGNDKQDINSMRKERER